MIQFSILIEDFGVHALVKFVIDNKKIMLKIILDVTFLVVIGILTKS